MKDNRKQRSLLESYKFYTRIPVFALAAILSVVTVFTILHVVFNKLVFMFLSVGIAASAFIFYIIYFFLVSKKLRLIFYKQIYETTYENINKIRNNDTNLLSYGDSDIKEVQQLDAATLDLKKKLTSSYLIVKEADYSKLNLEYVDQSKGLITVKTFKENLSNIIFVSQSFRNVLIEVYFELPLKDKLAKRDKKRLLDLYVKLFSDHHGVLFMFAEDDRSIVIYVPVIDSFTEIKEKLGYAVTNSSVTIRDDRGIRHIVAKYALVAYPYSSEEMMLGDLRFAKRQGDPYLLFLPQRYRENIA